MKQNYLNAVFTHLILERDYEPLRAGDGLIISGEEIKLLQKDSNRVNYLIELIDGDQLSAAAIGMKLASIYDLLWKSEPGKVVQWMVVFVFHGVPDTEKLSMISAARVHREMARKYLTLFTVSLGSGEVVQHTHTSLPVDGLDKLLRHFLLADNGEYESLPDFRQILAQKAKEYTIEFQAAKPTMTYNLIGLNIAIWFFMYLVAIYFLVEFEVLLRFGWKENGLIIQGQYWRLLTPIFLHAGPLPGFLPLSLHLLVNCYSLNVMGRYVERIYGHVKFLAVYLAAGVLGNIASFAFSPHPAVGASGAIFGLLGAMVYYGVENPKVYKKYFGSNIIATILLNIFIGFSLGSGIIDNFGHLGGLVGGFLTAGIVRVKARPDQFPSRYLFLVVTLFLAALGLYYGFHRWGSFMQIVLMH